MRDIGSDAKDLSCCLSLVLNQNCADARKFNFAWLLAFRDASSVKRRRMTDGGSPTHQESPGSQDDSLETGRRTVGEGGPG